MYFNCSIQKKRAANQSKHNSQKSKQLLLSHLQKGLQTKETSIRCHPNIQKRRPAVKCTCENEIETQYQISVLNKDLHLKMYIDQPLLSRRK